MHTLKISDSITLREIQMSDAQAIFDTIDGQREYLGRWLPFVEFTRHVGDTEAFIAEMLGAPDDKRELTFVIIADGEFAGLAGFKDTDRTNRKTEIGYWLGERFQGRGIMTAVVGRLCVFAFAELHLHRIRICCAVGNTPSANIPRRLGFRFEGIERDGELVGEETFRDIEVYAKLAGE